MREGSQMGFNSFQLKCIAVISMAIDHIGAVLFPQAVFLRIIGRLAFPIFCFQVVEGFLHTRDARRYLLRLGIFAAVSEIPYDLAFHGRLVDLSAQNVFFTLALGVLMMVLLRAERSIPLQILAALSVMLGASLLHTDYGGKGILLILAYYLFRERKALRLSTGAGWNLMYGLIYGFQCVQCYGVLATPLLALYNGGQGRKVKYFFYLFYPAHLLVLYAIAARVSLPV